VYRTILHVDMDAFYAAVEQRDRPEYRGRPVIVGSDPKEGKGRGIVATCSYEARKFGVHSAQPIAHAWRLCPQGIYVRPAMDKYARVSGRIMGILLEFTDELEQLSIDEAFLDVTGSQKLFGTGAAIAAKIKSRIRGELGLTASVGVASNKFVAKVASDLEKPDGLVVVEPGRERDFLAPLPIRRLWGVGPKTEAHLKKVGLDTIGSIARLRQGDLVSSLGKSGAHLWQLAQGIDDRPVERQEGAKSIGHEVTFERDTADAREIRRTVLQLAGKVAERLRESGARAKTVTVKYREADFSTFTRRTTLAESVDTVEKIFPVAWKLFGDLMREGVLVRLVGVYAGSLDTFPSGQMGLFEPAPARDRKLAAAIDDISRRFGGESITRAALVKKADGGEE